MSHVDRRRGFTLIELVLSMGFVSILMIAIAMTVIQISNIYNKGITLKEVNQTGRVIANELQSTIASSTPFSVDPGVGDKYLNDKLGVVSRLIKQDWGGRLCLGRYSFVWNYGKAIYGGDKTKMNTYSDSSDQINLVKIYDPSNIYCVETSKKVIKNDAIELLSSSQHSIAMHDIKITTDDVTAIDKKTGQQLYSIELTLGTNDQNALMQNEESETVCKPPSEPGSDPSYCSVVKFNIAARAGNALK